MSYYTTQTWRDENVDEGCSSGPYACTSCDSSFGVLDPCTVSGCDQVALCEGCSFECSDCLNWVCAGHVAALPTPGHVHMATHLCLACHRKRQQSAAA